MHGGSVVPGDGWTILGLSDYWPVKVMDPFVDVRLTIAVPSPSTAVA